MIRREEDDDEDIMFVWDVCLSKGFGNAIGSQERTQEMGMIRTLHFAFAVVVVDWIRTKSVNLAEAELQSE